MDNRKRRRILTSHAKGLKGMNLGRLWENKRVDPETRGVCSCCRVADKLAALPRRKTKCVWKLSVDNPPKCDLAMAPR
jgi:hypothetical protein